MVIRRG
jgi:broad specificity phosphatase PhoE